MKPDTVMKLLEDDEDETMHSGADLDAFTAALNSASQPSYSESAALSQGNNHTSSQLFQQWQNSQGHHMLSSEMDVKPHVSGLEYRLQHLDISSQQKQQQEPNRTQNSQGESQYQNLQNMNNQRAMAPEGEMNQMGRGGTQVPFALLLPVIIPQLDKDRAMQLNTLYQRLKKNEVSKDEFVRHMCSIVGDRMLKMAVYQLQMQIGGRTNQFVSKQQQDDCQQRQLEENTQTLGIQNSEQNAGNIQEPGRIQSSQGESQYQNLQNMNTQRAMAPKQAMNQRLKVGRGRTQVPFALLLPVIIPQLDKDRTMQLNTLYQRLKKNEVSKDEFVRYMRSIVGDHMLKMAVYKVQMQTGGRTNRFVSGPRASAQPAHLKGPSAGYHQGSVPQSLAQLHHCVPASFAT